MFTTLNTIAQNIIAYSMQEQSNLSQFISRWDLHYGIGQHHYKWSRTVSIISSLEWYPGIGTDKLALKIISPNGNMVKQLSTMEKKG